MAKVNFRSWTDGETVTAAQLNEQIRDNGNEIWKGTTNGDLDYYTSSTTKTRLGIGSAEQVLRVNGGVPTWGFATLPCAKAHRNSTQSIPNATYTQVQFNVEQIDTHGFINLASNNTRITVPTGMGGNYLLIANVEFDNYLGAKNTRIRKNGTTFIGSKLSIYPENGVGIGISDIEILADGDFVEFLVYQGSGNSINVLFASLSLVRI